MNLLKSLKEQSEVRNLSIDDLVIDIEYKIQSMKKMETAFGMTVSCTLEDPVMGGTINVFLPKSVNVTSEEAVSYNLGEVPPINLIFKGKNKNKFVIKFV
jgi:hypothetical protein